MSLRYNVYKNNEVLASVSGLDTVPFQEHGGLYELSYLPSQSVNPLREQYILQFALTEDIWKDFDSGDEVQISLIVTIYDENRENSEAFEFPYVKLPMPTSSQMK